MGAEHKTSKDLEERLEKLYKLSISLSKSESEEDHDILKSLRLLEVEIEYLKERVDIAKTRSPEDFMGVMPIEIIEDNLKIDPHNAVALGDLAFTWDRVYEMIRDSEKHFISREAFMTTQAYKRAEKEFKKISEHDMDEPMRSEISMFYFAFGDFNKRVESYEIAIKCFSKSLEFNPSLSPFFLYSKLGEIYYHKAVQHYPHFLDKDDVNNAVKYLKKAANIEPNNANINYSLGLVHITLEENEEAIICLKKALRLEKKEDAHLDFLAEICRSLGFVYNTLGEYHKAKKYFKEVIKFDPKCVKSYCTLATFFKSRKKRELYITKAVELIHLNPEIYTHEPLEETTNKVYIVREKENRKKGKPLFIFKEKEDRDELEYERRIMSSFYCVLENEPKYHMPLELFSVVSYKNKFIYVTFHQNGYTLLDMMEGSIKSSFMYSFAQAEMMKNLNDVADFLALIHAKFPAKECKIRKINLREKLENKLKDENMNLPENLVRKIIENFNPLYDSFEESTFVFNKDAHPENWIIHDKGITALDWEDKGLVPMQFDMVNLMEYGDYLNDKEKDKLIKAYMDAYNHYKGEKVTTNKKQFRLIYLNSVIHRAISLCSAWSSPDRPIMGEKRGAIMDNAIHAIDRIEAEHPSYYKSYQGNYIELKEGLEEMKSFVVQHKH